ncbi:hypothetical protein [Ralstonia solanacearum]|uniref:hypothetical protein n=1 Tax=Ralstonia solanacearum TaxID=305 RepID=UPI000F60DB89|nr:hypothetical protein [Ralstonia solanacearum]
MKELAWRWELSRALEDWNERMNLVGDIQEPSQPTASVSEARRRRGLEARQRFMAKRKPKTA